PKGQPFSRKQWIAGVSGGGCLPLKRTTFLWIFNEIFLDFQTSMTGFVIGVRCFSYLFLLKFRYVLPDDRLTCKGFVKSIYTRYTKKHWAGTILKYGGSYIKVRRETSMS
ncbi:MAG: hypothetical protein LUD00_12250, partial [Prevotellaceae bacterium]|nr:hypothetical protein [Prevotellaceae bacterium]